jgi:hypothetical protein
MAGTHPGYRLQIPSFTQHNRFSGLKKAANLQKKTLSLCPK